MQEKIIIKPGRELTDQEIKIIERRKIIFSTEDIGTLGHYDRFAGVRISSKITGACDYISCLMCKVRKNSSQENEYEIIFEETDAVKGVGREHVGGQANNGYNMRTLEEQLRYLKDTELAELLEDSNIIEQIKEKYEEERKSPYYSTHRFYGDGQRKMFWNETLDILSDMHLRDKAQVEKINEDGSKRLLSVIKDVKDEGYVLIEFPCKIEFKFGKNKLKFSKFISSEVKTIESREEIIKKCSKINTLLNLIPSNYQNWYEYLFVMPEDIHSEGELKRLITEIEQIQLENIDIDKLSFEEIDKLLGSYSSDYVFDSIIKEHDVEYILKRIKDTDDNELKKRMMKSFSKKDGDYTEEQSKSVKKTLIELLKDENGWQDNASVIAGFSKNLKGRLNFTEKMDILQLSIDAHNTYCQHQNYGVSDEYISSRERKQQNEQINMSLNALINQLFAEEEQIALVEEIISQKNYQAMLMILKECEFNGKRVESWRPREGDKYNGISIEQKGIMVEELMKYKDDAPEGWLRYDKTYEVPYIVDYIADKKRKQKTSAFEQITMKSIFYMVKRGVEKSARKKLKCFEDFREEIEGYIDVEEAINNIDQGKLHIDIPEKYMGTMIGKQGANIKRLQERLKELMEGGDIKIILHPQKDGHVITLEEIEEFIKKQRAKGQEEL